MRENATGLSSAGLDGRRSGAIPRAARSAAPRHAARLARSEGATLRAFVRPIVPGRPRRCAGPALALGALALALARAAAAGEGAVESSGLAAHGLTPGVSATADAFRIASGGIERGTVALATVEASLAVDGARLAGWSGVSAFVSGLGHAGGSPSERAGDAQALDNTDFPRAWKLAEAWVEVAGKRLGVRAGVLDVNADFDVIPAAAPFVNSSHGIGYDFSQSGVNGPGILPSTGLAARAAWRPARGFILQALAADGVPGDPDHPARTDLRWRRADGALLVAEAGWLACTSEGANAACGKLAIGAWRYTDAFERVRATGDEAPHHGSHGAYVLAEHPLLVARLDPARALAGWARFGFADADVNAFDRYLGAGLVANGLLPGGRGDALGLAVALARPGEDFRRERADRGLATASAEIALELTWRVPLAGGLAVQPDLQLVRHPGADPDVRDALVPGLRLQIER